MAADNRAAAAPTPQASIYTPAPAGTGSEASFPARFQKAAEVVAVAIVSKKRIDTATEHQVLIICQPWALVNREW